MTLEILKSLVDEVLKEHGNMEVTIAIDDITTMPATSVNLISYNGVKEFTID